MIFLVPNYISIEWVSTSIPTNTVNRRILGNVDIVATQWLRNEILANFCRCHERQPSPRTHVPPKREKSFFKLPENLNSHLLLHVTVFLCFQICAEKGKGNNFFIPGIILGVTHSLKLWKSVFSEKLEKKKLFFISPRHSLSHSLKFFWDPIFF